MTYELSSKFLELPCTSFTFDIYPIESIRDIGLIHMQTNSYYRNLDIYMIKGSVCNSCRVHNLVEIS